MRDRIIDEIRRIAAADDGRPPGKAVFARISGIQESAWSGRFWAKWSDALSEAGFTPNLMQDRIDPRSMLDALVVVCRHYGKVPSFAELKLYKQGRPEFPSKGAFAGHYRTRAGLIEALSRHCSQNSGLLDVAALLSSEESLASPAAAPVKATEGHVYLLKAGEFYKVGRSDNLERRVKEVRTAMPESLTLVHAIATDDPPGIEAYWHRRFNDRRCNGEWFRLITSDVTAFKRRKFQ